MNARLASRLLICGSLFCTGFCSGQQQKKTPLDLAGIPIYPGSKKVATDVSKPAANGSKRVYAEYSSTDDYTKVIAFYKAKLGLQEGVIPGVKMRQLVGKLKSGGFLQMYIGPNGPNKSKLQYYFILMPKK